MAKSNYPQGQLDEIQPEKVQELVTSLRQLHDKGKPQTDEEIRQRIDEYFSFCQQSSISPGIESLCMALHISRTTLFNWNNGTSCSKKSGIKINVIKNSIKNTCFLSCLMVS